MLFFDFNLCFPTSQEISCLSRDHVKKTKNRIQGAQRTLHYDVQKTQNEHF